MYNVSPEFKTAMESNIKSLDVRVKYKNDNEDIVTLIGSDAIISMKLSSESELGSSAIRKAEINLLKSRLPDSFYTLNVKEYFTVEYGVYIGTAFEYQYIGAFRIVDYKYKEDDETVNIIAYDRMHDTIIDYVDKMPEPTFWTANTTLAQYITKVLSNCLITLGDSNFLHNGMEITSDRFVSKSDSGGYVSNIFGYTVRDLINNICQISGTVAVIRPYNNEDRLYFRKLDVNTIDYTISSLGKLVSYKVYDRYGDINKVIFAREPQQDYVAKTYPDSIKDYGVTEWKVDNNQLVDYQPIIDPKNPTLTPPKDVRSDYLPATFHAICGAEEYPHLGAVYYYPFEAETTGYGWFEIGDRVRFSDTDTFILSYSVNFDGGIQENISSRKTNKIDTKVSYKPNKDQNQTQLIVDKQNQVITNYVKITEGNTENIVTLVTTSKAITASLTKTGGYNLIKNSVMYNNYLDDKLILQAKYWTRANLTDGTLLVSYIGKSRSTSGNQFTLDGEKVSQIIIVQPNITYSFAFSVQKGTGLGYVKIYDGAKVYTIDITSDPLVEYNLKYKDTLIFLQPSITIELYGLLNSQTSFTDVVLCEGDSHKLWKQADGEIINDSVLIDNSGITVKGDGNIQTIISPTEFSGIENGQTIFTLNNQTTIVNKLKANNEINMPPLKILSLDKGWALVRSDY